MEPEWVKSIPSEIVCNWFYVFFWIYASLAVVTLVGSVGIFGAYKIPLGLKLGLGLGYFITLSIAALNLLFMYIICDRALLANSSKKEGFFAKHGSGARPKRATNK